MMTICDSASYIVKGCESMSARHTITNCFIPHNSDFAALHGGFVVIRRGMTARILRCFVKPAGQQWVDLPLAPNQTAAQVFSILKTEGALVADHFILPFDALLYAGMITIEDGRPRLNVVPGPGWTPGIISAPDKPPDDPPA